LIAANASLPVQPSGHGGRFARGRLGRQIVGPEPRLLILLIRVVIGPIGPIGLDLTGHQPVTLRAPASLIGPVLPAGPAVAPVAEWRLGSHSRSRGGLPGRGVSRGGPGPARGGRQQTGPRTSRGVVSGAPLPAGPRGGS